jgi:hypothetical protein
MKNKLVFVLIIGGLLFSGYLSGVKFFTDTCAFSEACPYFLGYPACWYGFFMYLIMFVVTLFSLFGKVGDILATKINLIVSFVGILFAGRFVIQELLRSQVTGALGLSTCAYGFIFYVLIFVFSLHARKQLMVVQ